MILKFFALCNSEDGQGQEVPGTLQNVLTFHLFVLLVSLLTHKGLTGDDEFMSSHMNVYNLTSLILG